MNCGCWCVAFGLGVARIRVEHKRNCVSRNVNQLKDLETASSSLLHTSTSYNAL